mgnify:CR=1 FL=1
MKMTKTEWRYLQRIALDHPYYDTHKLPLTEKEAKAIVEANNKMTGEEFVDSVYAKLGMVRPQEEKKRFAWLRNMGELFSVPPIRRIAIAVLVVVLMTVFFAATPTGRAIAESVVRYIATLLDDGSLAIKHNNSDNEMSPYYKVYDEIVNDEMQNTEDITAHIVYVDSIDGFITETGKTPIILPLDYTELYYVYDEVLDYVDINAAYVVPEGKLITYQVWNTDDYVSSTSTEYGIYDADADIYYSIEETGVITITKVPEDSVFSVVSTGNFALDELAAILKDG